MHQVIVSISHNWVWITSIINLLVILPSKITFCSFFLLRKFHWRFDCLIELWYKIIFIIIVIRQLDKWDTSVHLCKINWRIWMVDFRVNWGHSLSKDLFLIYSIFCKSCSFFFKSEFFVKFFLGSSNLLLPEFRVVLVSSLDVHVIINFIEVHSFLVLFLGQFLSIITIHLFFNSKCLLIHSIFKVFRMVWVFFAIICTSINLVFEETIDTCSSLG